MAYTRPGPSAADASWYGRQEYTALDGGSADATWLPPAPNTLYPAGIVSGGVGAPVITKTPSLSPVGFSGDMGEPTVWLRVRSIEASGVPGQLFGDTNVWFRYRYVQGQGDVLDSYGNPVVGHWNRSLLGLGDAHSSYGMPTVSYGTRFIEPTSIFEFFPMAHMVGGRRFLQPEGFDAVRFGTRIIPQVQQVFPSGFSGVFGSANAYNQTQQAFPIGFISVGRQPEERMGTAKVHNDVQYVRMFYDPESELNPPAWPKWTLIDNRNRKSIINGWVASLVSSPIVENKARQIIPQGVQPPELPIWKKVGMVAYRVRPVQIDGIEPPYMSTWANVRNAARVLDANGSINQEFGKALVENRSRELSYIGGVDSAWCGYPFVAHGVRHLEFESRYGIEPPYIPLPDVRLHTQYIEPGAIGPKQVGAAAVEIHWTIITPRWSLQNFHGVPTVRNKTPEIATYGAAMDDWGDAKVRLQWRPVDPIGEKTELFGITTIADRRQYISVPGSNYLHIGEKLVVVKTGSPPYSMQYIWLDSVNNQDSGFGIPAPEDGDDKSQVGKPAVRQNIIYVHEEHPQTRFGNPLVTANSIRVEPGYAELLVGEPLIGLRVRRLQAKGIAPQSPGIGTPRLNPHTIYAVVEAPDQAQKNHNSEDLHYVDSKKEGGIGAVFGQPVVELQHRIISQWGQIESSIGMASVENYTRYLQPTGFRSMRFGWHSIPGPQMVEFFTEISTMEIGTPTVGPPPYLGTQTIISASMIDSEYGNPQIELLNREVLPVGLNSMEMGKPKSDDQPFMWQGLRIGPLVPNTPEGFMSEVFGETWVSLRVREVTVDGFDSFLSEYDYHAFDKRMRVNRGVTNDLLPKISVSGGQHDSFGTPNARLSVQYIRPDGNSDQHRKGAPS